MAWRRKHQGHQKPSYWSDYQEIFPFNYKSVSKMWPIPSGSHLQVTFSNVPSVQFCTWIKTSKMCSQRIVLVQTTVYHQAYDNNGAMQLHIYAPYYNDVIMSAMASQNHQRLDCLLNHLFRRRSQKTQKLRVTGFCAGNQQWPVDSPRKGLVTRKMFPFDDVIIIRLNQLMKNTKLRNNTDQHDDVKVTNVASFFLANTYKCFCTIPSIYGSHASYECVAK